MLERSYPQNGNANASAAPFKLVKKRLLGSGGSILLILEDGK